MPAASSRRPISANAAHDEGGLPIGIEETLHVDARHVAFPSGSKLLCYSDGITDSMGFGGDRARLVEWFARSTYPDADGLADALLETAAPGGATQRDDMSVIVVKAR